MKIHTGNNQKINNMETIQTTRTRRNTNNIRVQNNSNIRNPTLKQRITIQFTPQEQKLG
jgi:transcriptional regulator of met regulon